MAVGKSGIIEEPCKSWFDKLNINNLDSKLRTYSQFKQDFQIENYLLNFNNFEKRKYFTKLSISSHDLQIETGRYNKQQKTPVQKRICNYCNMQNIEDVFHFVMECPNYKKTP